MKTLPEPKPRPCPFCGPGNSVVEAYYDDVAHRYRVGCGRCGSRSGVSPGGGENDKNTAIARWNQRAELDRALTIIAEAYQIVGVLANRAGMFDHPDVQRALDVLADPENATESLLPLKV